MYRENGVSSLSIFVIIIQSSAESLKVSAESFINSS